MPTHEEELEIVILPNGSSTVKVVTSKRPCSEVSRPFEEAMGKVSDKKDIPNPGQKGEQHLRGSS